MNNNDLEHKITRKKYSPQFKDQALERADKDGIPQVEKDLGLAEALLYSNTLKFIAIENDFIRYLGMKHLYHLKSKKWLSKVDLSDFPGQRSDSTSHELGA